MNDNTDGLPFEFLQGRGYEDQLITWALKYDAYERIAAGEFEPWGVLPFVLRPLSESFREEGTVPEWAGVDLLRAWAFLLVRQNRHEDGFLLQEHPEILVIARAIMHHRGSVEADMPPPLDEDFAWIFE